MEELSYTGIFPVYVRMAKDIPARSGSDHVRSWKSVNIRSITKHHHMASAETLHLFTNILRKYSVSEAIGAKN